MFFQKLIRLSSSRNQRLNLLPASRSLCAIGSLSGPSGLKSKRSSLNERSFDRGATIPVNLVQSRTLSSQSSSDKSPGRSSGKSAGQSADQSADNRMHSADGQWHVSAGLVIQRYPLLMPELNVVERSFHEYNLKLEYAKSLLSDYDYAIHKVRNEGSALEEHLQLVSKYENNLKELSAFKDGGRKTEADLKNDLKSYERCPDRSLYLVTKLMVGKEPRWTFPFVVLNKEDGSLREACERLLSAINDKAKFRILGNSPFTYLKYRYPKKLAERLQMKGNKIFLFKCQLIDLKHDCSPLDKSLIADYDWLNTDECRERLTSCMWRSVRRGLLAENMDEFLLNQVNEKLNEKKLEIANG